MEDKNLLPTGEVTEMSKYGEALGIWELKVGRTEAQGPLKLVPKLGDNRKLLGLLSDVRKKDSVLLFNKFHDFMVGLISRDYPPDDDKEKEELAEYVEFNLIELLTETQIRFKMTTREEIDAAKKNLLSTSLEKID